MGRFDALVVGNQRSTSGNFLGCYVRRFHVQIEFVRLRSCYSVRKLWTLNVLFWCSIAVLMETISSEDVVLELVLMRFGAEHPTAIWGQNPLSIFS